MFNAHTMAWQAGYDCFWAGDDMDLPYGWGDYWHEYEDGFLSAWEEHDNDILREEKPWLFYDPASWAGHAVARKYVLTRDCFIFDENSPLFN